jgi:hypothetical protein
MLSNAEAIGKNKYLPDKIVFVSAETMALVLFSCSSSVVLASKAAASSSSYEKTKTNTGNINK